MNSGLRFDFFSFPLYYFHRKSRAVWNVCFLGCNQRDVERLGQGLGRDLRGSSGFRKQTRKGELMCGADAARPSTPGSNSGSFWVALRGQPAFRGMMRAGESVWCRRDEIRETVVRWCNLTYANVMGENYTPHIIGVAFFLCMFWLTTQWWTWKLVLICFQFLLILWSGHPLWSRFLKQLE